jgi:hypothetical protein
MIREYEFYHGAVLKRLVQSDSRITLQQFVSDHSYGAAYIVNGNIGLYIKHSTGRLSPWSFTFSPDHQADIDAMYKRFGEVFICLVCKDDGVVCLDYLQLKSVLDERFTTTEWVRVARHKREKYSVSGSDGKLRVKIGENEFPTKVFARRLR